jgi:prepilin-type N-terminal cleavage/methylation domain-containing protein
MRRNRVKSLQFISQKFNGSKLRQEIKIGDFAFVSCRKEGFTLLEVLVAVTVMSLMLTFMFSLLSSSLSLWESGNRRIEAAQAARVGLNIIANDLKNAFAGNMTGQTSTGTQVQNIAPFQFIGSPTSTLGLGGGSVNAAGSEQLCGVLLSGNATVPFHEFGFFCAFLTEPNGFSPMIGLRYYLVKKVDDISTTGGNFFLRGGPNSTWYASSTEFYPIIDNCVRLTFDFFGNETDPFGVPSWTSSWSPADRLPLGVLVTATVLDSRTAEKVAAIIGGSAISSNDLDAIFSNTVPANPTQRLLRQGAVTVRRFIPLNKN